MTNDSNENECFSPTPNPLGHFGHPSLIYFFKFHFDLILLLPFWFLHSIADSVWILDFAWLIFLLLVISLWQCSSIFFVGWGAGIVQPLLHLTLDYDWFFVDSVASSLFPYLFSYLLHLIVDYDWFLCSFQLLHWFGLQYLIALFVIHSSQHMFSSIILINHDSSTDAIYTDIHLFI